MPLAPPAEAEAYLAKNAGRSTRAATRCAREIAAIEKPHRDRLELAMIKARFSDAIYQAAAKPEQRADAGRAAAGACRSSRR